MSDTPSSSAPALQALQAQRAYKKTAEQAEGSAIDWEIVQQYLPLVKANASRMRLYFPSNFSTDDLYSIGLQGLVKAAMNYDTTRIPSFGAYANLKIRGALLDELRRMDSIPRMARKWAKKIRAAIQTLEQQLGRAATEEEIADTLELSLNEYHQRLEQIRPVSLISLDHVCQETVNGETLSLHERIEDLHVQTASELCESVDRLAWIKQHITTLDPTTQKVLGLYYSKGLRLAEIGLALGLTESRICQIHTQAILSLKACAARYNNTSTALNN